MTQDITETILKSDINNETKYLLHQQEERIRLLEEELKKTKEDVEETKNDVCCLWLEVILVSLFH